MPSPSIIANLAAMGAHSVGTVAVASIDSVTGSPDPVTEGNTITWTVNTTNIPNGTSLNWFSNNTADTNPDSGTVTINSDTGSFTMTAVADGVTEGDENITVFVSGNVGGTAVSRTSTTVTIQDPAAGAIVSVTATSNSVNEGSSATFSVVTSNIPNGTLIGWSVVFGGNVNPAATADDFNQISGTATVNNNAASISVPITSDNVTEGSEDFRVLANYAPSSSSQTSGYVTINDTSTTPAVPTVTSVVGPASVNEGSNATITVSTANIPDSTILNWAINNGTTSNSDFGVTSGTVTITSNSGSFNIPTVADSTTEGEETFTVTVSGTVSSTAVSKTSINIIINDTSTTPTPTYAVVAPTTINEGSAGTMNVTTSNVVNGTTLYWTVLPAGDFATSSGSFQISSNSASFSVIPSADSTTEGTESGTIQIRTGSISGTIVATDTFNIGDTSTTPATFTVSSASTVNEGDNLAVSIGGNAPAGASGDYTMNWVINHITTAAADFSATSGTVTASILGGNIVGAFNIVPVADNTTEGSQTFTVTVSGTIQGSSLSDTSSTITVIDTSLTPVSYSFGGDSTVVEGGVLTFNATRSSGVGSTTIYYQILRTNDATFGRIDDPTGSITFSADGLVSATSGTSINNLFEGAPTGFIGGKIEFFSDSGLTNELPNSPHTFTMSNAAPTLVSVVGPSSVNEGSSASVTVTVTNVPDGETLNWAVSNGTTVNADFGSTSGTVTLNGNSGTFSVPISADTTTEGSETFSVDVSGTILSTSLSGSTSNITINDTSVTPATPVINSVTGPSSVNEGSAATINVSTSDIPNGTVLNWSVTNTSDFATTTGTVTINTNAGSFTVTPVADQTTEGSETFTVTVSGTVSGTPVSVTSAAITINDTSVDPVVSINSVSGPASVNEGSSATINVGTSNVPNGTSLNWAINNVSTVNADFGSTSGTVTISGNAGSFTIPIVADSTTEGSETFTVTVSGSVTPSVGSGTSQSVTRTSSSITINDTSTTPLSPSVDVVQVPVTIDEGDTETINVFTSNIPNGTTLIWRFAQGGSSFDITTGTFTVNGDTGSFTITPTADETTEGDKSAQLVVGDPASGIDERTSVSFTVRDTSTTPKVYSLTADQTSIGEGPTQTVTFTLTATSGGVNESLTGSITGISVADLSDEESQDLTPTFNLSSANGYSASISYNMEADNLTEGTETMTLTVAGESVSVTINDTSQTPAASTYAVDAPTLDENGIIVYANEFTVTTTNVSNGTTLYWNITPTGEFDTTSGSFTVNSNEGTFSVTPTRDFFTEGTETYTINVRTGSVSGTIVATNTGNITDSAKNTMYNWAYSPVFHVVKPSGGANYMWYWDDVFIGQDPGGPTITDGTYNYTRGDALDVISDKNGQTTYYEITRTPGGGGPGGG